MEALKFCNSVERFRVANICPCGKSNKDGKFSPFRENPSCGYCHSCDRVFFDKEERAKIVEPIEPPPPPSYLNAEEERHYLSNYENNNLIKALKLFFEIKEIEQKAKIYGIGTEQEGKTIFYQIDRARRIRGGKIMLYDEKTAKRVKDSPHAFNWVHSKRKIKDYNLKQCLFGLHLIKNDKKPIAIVESEKTAFILSLFYDDFYFVATGGKGNLKFEVLAPIINKEIVLFPDAGEYKFWHDIGQRLNDTGFNITTSHEMESHPIGTDLADLMINKN